MAGDWIKMRTALDTNPRVLQLADALQVHPLHVVGMLWKLWSWADAHSLDGNALGVTDVTLDRFVDRPGFAAALRKVGWLEGRDTALSFPRFEQHNGQTAKNRAETKDRVARHRNGKGATPVTPPPLPEKRREDERRKQTPPTPVTPAPPDPAPSAPPAGEPPAAGGGEGEIRGMIQEAKRLGCQYPGKVLREAVRLCGVDHVRGILSHFGTHATARGWTGADLHGRLDSASPGQPPDQGWDAGTPSKAKGDEDKRLEATYGPVLDRMPSEKYLALAREVLTDRSVRSQFELDEAGSRQIPAVRRAMLRHIANLPPDNPHELPEAG